jgi:hypothetical protein
MTKKEIMRKVIEMIQESLNDPLWNEEREKELKDLIDELNKHGDALKMYRDYRINHLLSD